MRIAVLEDDKALAELLEAILSAGGHAVHLFSDCRSIKVALRQESFDLLLFDWHLPDGEGIDVLLWAQEQCEPCPPVIIVTGRSDDKAIVQALEAGADDYVVKPVQPEVLLARVTALLRRTYKQAPDLQEREELHGICFDHARCSVEIDGRVERLTSKEFGLALLLFRNINRPLSRTHLLESVWGRNPDLSTRTLDVHVSRLRSRLGLRPENGYTLTPVHSFGYRLEQVCAR